MSRHAIITATRLKGPMTAKQLASELGIGDGSVRTSIRRAREGGRTDLIRIAGWAQDVPKYGPGPGDDEEGGSTRDLVLRSLSDEGPATVAKLAQRLGVTVDMVDNAVRRIRKSRQQRIHVNGWQLRRGSGGREAAIYASGPGKDAPRPSFKDSQKQAEKRYQEKKRIARGAGRMRGPRKRADGPVAGFFDGLMR